MNVYKEFGTFKIVESAGIYAIFPVTTAYRDTIHELISQVNRWDAYQPTRGAVTVQSPTDSFLMPYSFSSLRAIAENVLADPRLNDIPGVQRVFGAVAAAPSVRDGLETVGIEINSLARLTRVMADKLGLRAAPIVMGVAAPSLPALSAELAKRLGQESKSKFSPLALVAIAGLGFYLLKGRR